MAALRPSTLVSGDVVVVEADPPLLDLRDVIFVPFGDPHSQPGLFDHGQKMVLQSWYFRGPNPLGGPGHFGTGYTLNNLPQVAPDENYVYGGWLHDHFGHFLLSSLSRFWCPAFADPTVRVVVHAHMPIADWFARSWAGTLFSGLGLTPERFVRFEHATRIPRILVPGPAFCEENFAHRVFATGLNALGARLAAGRIDAAPDPRPVFLSKAGLTRGVQKILNEHEITAVLERAGVEVVAPHALDFRDQVALWHNRSHLASFADSAAHVSIFAPGRDVTVVSYGPAVVSNFTLVDRVNRAEARYLFPAPGQLETHRQRDGFDTAHIAHHPRAIAEDLLRAFDLSQRSAASRAGVPVWPRDRFWRAPDADPGEAGLVNLALGRPFRQSSMHPGTAPMPAGAVSGALTGLYGFHTDRQNGAWWEVDLGDERPVHRVRLFNRADEFQDRCARFSITLKRDDGLVSAEHRQDEPIRFHGLDGDPFTWILPVPVPARVVRVALLEEDYLHLDQVEVMGPVREAGADTATGGGPSAVVPDPVATAFRRPRF